MKSILWFSIYTPSPAVDPMVLERVDGVALDHAWGFLAANDPRKMNFKREAGGIIFALNSLKSTSPVGIYLKRGKQYTFDKAKECLARGISPYPYMNGGERFSCCAGLCNQHHPATTARDNPT